MLFVIIRKDISEALPIRQKYASQHKAYFNQHADRIVYGGAFLNESKDVLTGSLIVVDMPDEESVQAFLEGDPYTQAEMFTEVSVFPFKLLMEKGLRLVEPD